MINQNPGGKSMGIKEYYNKLIHSDEYKKTKQMYSEIPGKVKEAALEVKEVVMAPPKKTSLLRRVIRGTQGLSPTQSEGRKLSKNFQKALMPENQRVPNDKQRRNNKIAENRQRLLAMMEKYGSQTYDEQTLQQYSDQQQESIARLRMHQTKALRMREQRNRLHSLQKQQQQASNILQTPNMFDPNNPLASNWGNKTITDKYAPAENVFSQRNPRRMNILVTGRPSILSKQSNNILHAQRLNFGSVNLREGMDKPIRNYNKKMKGGRRNGRK